MGDRGLFVPDSESESLKILFCARAFLSAVVNLTGLAASFSSDSDAANDSELEKNVRIEYLQRIANTQCANSMIVLSLSFYVKSILGFLEVQNLPF